MSDHCAVEGKEAPWTTYTLPSVEAAHAPREGKKEDFVSLQLVSGGQAEFVPLLGKSGKSVSTEELNAPALEEKMALIEKEAYEKGFAQGEKDGYELGEIRAGKVIEKIECLLDELTCLRSGLVKQYEKDMLGTIVAIAEKVIHAHLQLDETAVEDTILAALGLATGNREVTLLINPEDFEYVETLKPGLLSRHTNVKSIMITADPAIIRGGCRLETTSGDVDATIESQLEVIQQSLKDAFME